MALLRDHLDLIGAFLGKQFCFLRYVQERVVRRRTKHWLGADEDGVLWCGDNKLSSWSITEDSDMSVHLFLVGLFIRKFHILIVVGRYDNTLAGLLLLIVDCCHCPTISCRGVNDALLVIKTLNHLIITSSFSSSE